MALGEYHGPDRAMCFCRYLRARYMASARREAFRVYLTDAVRFMGMGKYPKTRYAEIFKPREEDKSAEQLLDEFLAKYEAMGGEE